MEGGGYIYDRAFYGCKSLTDITITGMVHDEAFYGCKNLEKITFKIEDDKAIDVGRNAFADCVKLEDVIFDELGALNRIGFAENSFHNTKILNDASDGMSGITSQKVLLRYSGADKELTITGEEVAGIANKAFTGSSLKKIVIDGVDIIGFMAFSSYPAKVADDQVYQDEIDGWMLEMASQKPIDEVRINNVKYIGTQAFYGQKINKFSINQVEQIYRSALANFELMCGVILFAVAGGVIVFTLKNCKNPKSVVK